MKHHIDRGSDSDFSDPASWNKASYDHHPCDDFEALPDKPNGYRQAALYHLRIMLAVDEFVTTATDARAAQSAVFRLNTFRP